MAPRRGRGHALLVVADKQYRNQGNDMKLTTLPQFKRDAGRFMEIVSVLANYGLADWLETHEPEFIKNLRKKGKNHKYTELTHEARVRRAFTELGTTFIKLGQIMSTRKDIVGPALAEELTQLQSSTPADPPEVVVATFTTEIGSPPEELFSEFDSHAVASASIGQIHQARLHDGRPVVVKIQHAGIEPKVASDLDILMTLAEFAEKVDTNFLLYQPRITLAAFRRSLLRELDFLREQKNLDQFARNPAADEGRQLRCLPGAPPAGHNRQSFGLLYIDCGPFSGFLLFAGPENSTIVCRRIDIWCGRLSAVSITWDSTFQSDQKIG